MLTPRQPPAQPLRAPAKHHPEPTTLAWAVVWRVPGLPAPCCACSHESCACLLLAGYSGLTHWNQIPCSPRIAPGFERSESITHYTRRRQRTRSRPQTARAGNLSPAVPCSPACSSRASAYQPCGRGRNADARAGLLHCSPLPREEPPTSLRRPPHTGRHDLRLPASQRA